MRTTTEDIAVVSAILDDLDDNAVVAGHSYGGVVISGATAGRTDVDHLLYVCAAVPDRGEDVLAGLFGEELRDVGFFRFGRFEFQGEEQIIARSGYSRQGGFEIYLRGGHHGPALWDAVWHAGEPHNIRPGCPNLIERIEGGLFSYGNEMTRDNNPFECGLGGYCDLDNTDDFLGKAALTRIRDQGHEREIRGILFEGEPCPPCGVPWPVMTGQHGGRQIGQITSAAYSPRLEQNVGLAMITRSHWTGRESVTVLSSDGQAREGSIEALPFR